MIQTFKVFIFFLVISVTYSCKKKDEYYTGIVYSKHHIPMPHLGVNFGYTKGNDNDRAGFYEVTTDDNGRYLLQKKIPRNIYIESISIHSDSGYYQNDVYNNAEIILQ